MKLLLLSLLLSGCAAKDEYGIPEDVTEDQAREILAEIGRDVQALKGR